MASNSPNSPRQKMINLMYLVFIAMLALNVPAEVLDSFVLVGESLGSSATTSSSKNEHTFDNIKSLYQSNPEKTEKWYLLAQKVKEKSDSLYNFIAEKKIEIVKNADGEKGNPDNLQHPDDLNAAFEVMMAPGKKGGERLREDVESYREFITSLILDTIQKQIIETNLSTTPSEKAKKDKQSWEGSMFYQMPLVASITLMTKLQNDVRSAESEALNTLLKNIDVGDFRVNKIEAFVIPKSQTVVQGGTYSANLVLAAVDSTQTPRIFVNGKELPQKDNGLYQVGTSSTGSFPIKGYIEVTKDGLPFRRDFSSEYFVVEPSATIFPTLMNVLYANYENPIEIAVPGVPGQSVSATMSNGRLERKGNNIWNAYPSKAGTDAVITVTANIGGKTQTMANRSYRVRPLPDPMPFIEYTDENGNPKKFRGGRLPKSILLNTEDLKAAIDDDLLRVNFSVIRFETMFFDAYGNALPVPSDGSKFSSAQKDRLRSLSKGKTFYIRGVVARGPGGDERTLSPIEVTVN